MVILLYSNLLLNYVTSGAVGCCGTDRAILGEEEIEKRDEFSENVDNRFI